MLDQTSMQEACTQSASCSWSVEHEVKMLTFFASFSDEQSVACPQLMPAQRSKQSFCHQNQTVKAKLKLTVSKTAFRDLLSAEDIMHWTQMQHKRYRVQIVFYRSQVLLATPKLPPKVNNTRTPASNVHSDSSTQAKNSHVLSKPTQSD